MWAGKIPNTKPQTRARGKNNFKKDQLKEKNNYKARIRES